MEYCGILLHANQPFWLYIGFTGLSRCGKSCRLRWMNYLRPGVKRGNYTEEEERMIIKLHEELGNKYELKTFKFFNQNLGRLCR